MLTLGTQTASAIVTDRRDVQGYEEHWAELEPIVSYDEAARAAVERVATDYRNYVTTRRA